MIKKKEKYKSYRGYGSGFWIQARSGFYMGKIIKVRDKVLGVCWKLCQLLAFIRRVILNATLPFSFLT